MTSVAPAPNGARMHIPTETPRVHGVTTPITQAQRRAGHPLAGGRLGKQNAVRTILGRLVSSSLKSQEHEHIGGRRQAGILTRQSPNDVHTHNRIFYAE